MTTPPPPEDTPDTTYLAFFTAQRPAFVQAVAQDCQAQIELYRQLPFAAVEQNIDQTFGVYMDAFIQSDTGAIVGWIEQRLSERMVQGVRFSEALRIPAIFRHHLVGFSLPAVARQIPGAIEGITFANVACDAMVDQIGDLYRRRLEATTAELRRFQVLAETAIDGIAVANARFKVTYANRAFGQLTGYGEHVVGMPTSELVDPATLQQTNAAVLPELRRTGSWRGVVNYRHADGSIFPIRMSIVALKDDQGAFDGTAVVVQDIREQQAREQRLRTFEALVENAIDGMSVTGTQSNFTYINAAGVRMNGYTAADEMIGMWRPALIAPEEQWRIDNEITPQLQETGAWQGVIWAIRPDGSRWLAQSSTFALSDADGRTIALGGVTRDITAEHQAASDRAHLQEEVIRVQEAALRELSTPLLTISDHAVVMPLIGTLDPRRAQQMIESLLQGITSSGADTAILDITGVPVVDTHVANALVRAAQAVRLLGARIVLTGIRPEVAQTLISLGADLSEIVSRSSLQSGIAYAIGPR